jgi:hypothetical protein
MIVTPVKVHVFYLLCVLDGKDPRYLSQSSVWLRTGRPGDQGSIPGRGKIIFPRTSVSRPALGPTQPPVQWVPGVLSPGLKHG